MSGNRSSIPSLFSLSKPLGNSSLFQRQLLDSFFFAGDAPIAIWGHDCAFLFARDSTQIGPPLITSSFVSIFGAIAPFTCGLYKKC